MFDDAPYTHLPAKDAGGMFVFCDHATNHVPAHLDNLGLSDKDLQRHIGWDIGAEALTRQFCKTFGCAGLLAGFSRLVIDPNRALNSPSLIPKISDSTVIPGNQNLTHAQRQARIDGLYLPYHRALERELDEAVARNIDPLVISIHSFTPQMQNGATRDLDIGLLWKVDEDMARNVQAAIEKVQPYKIGLNAPYSAMHLNHTMDVHVIPRGLRLITFEVRQDLIDTEAKAAIVAAHLTTALKAFIKR